MKREKISYRSANKPILPLVGASLVVRHGITEKYYLAFMFIQAQSCSGRPWKQASPRGANLNAPGKKRFQPLFTG